jgi:hypothetical protein
LKTEARIRLIRSTRVVIAPPRYRGGPTAAPIKS